MNEILSLIGSLLLIVLILVLTWYATRWYARRMGQSVSGKYVRVLDRSQLGNGTFVSVIQVGEKYYLLGVGDKKVSLLCELEDFEPPEPTGPGESLSFSQAFRQVMEKYKKGGDDRP